jgi:integrase
VKAADWELYTGKNLAARVKKFSNIRGALCPIARDTLIAESAGRRDASDSTFFRCQLLTGARRNEVRLMKWPHLDLDRALCHKPTTKNGVPHTILLPAQPVIWLEMLPCLTDWAFPSNPNAKNGMRVGEWSVTDIEHWQRIRRRVGVTDVRIHDFRCAAASCLVIN